MMRTHGFATVVLAFVLSAFAAFSAARAAVPVGSAGDPAKVADLVYTDKRPEIDARFDDPVWQTATIVDDLHQTIPVNGGTPSQKTVFKLAYDENALYIAVHVYETDPSLIVANQLVQGGSVRADDRIQIILDPYLSHRSGYAFFINANGIQGEGLYDRPYQINGDWEGIWYGEARIVDDGWVAEIEIPFKTISFDQSLYAWGFSLVRRIERNGEVIAWTSKNRNTNPNAAGILNGVNRAQQGVGLDIVPSLAVKSHKANVYLDTSTLPATQRGGHEDVKLVPSINAFYKITPSLTASLTANTDFSNSDVDDRVVNLSRFSVFFPEKRSFFLQDADIFGFGNVEENGIPFFSRRIGLSAEGDPVDIVVGAKTSGRMGIWNIGVLGVLQDSQPTVGQSELMIARASANVLKESSIGFISTYGDPLSDDDNALVGADFVYANTSLVKGKALEASGWFQITATNGETRESQAYGGSIGLYSRDGFFGAITHKTLEDNFHPALGFANWTGIQLTEAFGGYRRRPKGSSIREITHSFFTQHVFAMDGEKLFELVSLQPFEIITNANDSARLRIKHFRETIRPDEAYYIWDGILIGAADYDFHRAELVLDTSKARSLSWHGEADVGGFYNGYRVRLYNQLSWRPNKHIFIGAGLGYNDIELPDGNFNTRLGTFRADVAFTSKIALLNFVQYDNVSDAAALNTRLRWQPRPGDEYVFIANYGAHIGQDGQIYSRDTELVLKAERTFRF